MESIINTAGAVFLEECAAVSVHAVCGKHEECCPRSRTDRFWLVAKTSVACPRQVQAIPGSSCHRQEVPAVLGFSVDGRCQVI